jgi:uncharacterized protein (DUF433 family)
MTDAAFSPAEAAALLSLPERQVRKELEHGLIPAGTPPRLHFWVLVYFEAIRLMGLELAVSDRGRVVKAIRDALVHGEDVVRLSPVLNLEIRDVVRDLTRKLDAFERWKTRLVTDEKILGGEPVFPKSRLSVRHVGGIAARGETVRAILEDYPYLTEQDVTFAVIYAQAYPRLGRPRERQAPAR